MDNKLKHISAGWHINSYCNYDCVYCFCRGMDKKKLFLGNPDYQQIVNAINNSGMIWFIVLTGGEPFFHPNIVELCQGLTARHRLAFNTNLSHKRVFDFAEKVNPEQIEWLHCSIHIGEMERLNLVDSFIKKYRLLQERGFPVVASYVFYPPFLDRFEQDYQFFKSQGVILWPKIFKGQYTPVRIASMKGILRKVNRAFEKMLAKNYPESFTCKEKEQIRVYMDRSKKDYMQVLKQAGGVMPRTTYRQPDVWYDRQVLSGVPSFKGRLCRAGKDYVVLSEKGNLRRCHGEYTALGNIYEGRINLMPEVQPCHVDQCLCPMEGFSYLKDGSLSEGMSD